MQNIMKTARVPVKGLGYLETFFEVNVGAKLVKSFARNCAYIGGAAQPVSRLSRTIIRIS